MTDHDYYGPYGIGTAHEKRIADETALRTQNFKNTLAEANRISRKPTSTGFSSSPGKFRSGGNSQKVNLLAVISVIVIFMILAAVF